MATAASIPVEVTITVVKSPRLLALEALEVEVLHYLRHTAHTHSPAWSQLHGAYILSRETEP